MRKKDNSDPVLKKCKLEGQEQEDRNINIHIKVQK